MKSVVAAILLTAASVAQATPLTVPVGETWTFAIKDGDPVNAHKVPATAKPAKGQIMISVRALFGTNMIVTNNSRVAYTFHAELLSGGKVTAARPCDLPAKPSPILEQWPQKADAVRISHFVAAGTEGRC